MARATEAYYLPARRKKPQLLSLMDEAEPAAKWLR